MKAVQTLLIVLFVQAIACGQDLPNPPANMQTLPQDSYIIAMDNTWQVTTGTNPSFHFFNLKAYGLVVYLLNNNIKVKRVIRSGKLKDEADFSASCRQIKPTAEAMPSLRAFKAGPFVISGPDLLRVNINQLIDNYNNNYGGVSGIGSDTAKVRVYKTTADVTVDVRYDLSGFKPKVSILTDGSVASGIDYGQVHLTYLTLAGVPAANYTTGTNANLDVSCFTFASEPHNDYQNQTVANNIKNFVLAGGNFLAQCAAVLTYENQLHLQSNNGISLVLPQSPAPPTYFSNADLAMAQFEGSFALSQGGTRHWKYGTNSFANGAHFFVTNTNGPANGNSLIGVSASKLTSASSPGGMVFYLSNHSYTRTDDYNQLNGMRMYLNALLTPSDIKNILSYTFNADCNAGTMKVVSFNGPVPAYPVSFYLYQDNGSISGVVDPGDSFIGATSVAAPGLQKLIPLSGSDPKGEFVMKVVPSASCYKTEQVSPSPCRLSTLSVALRNFTARPNGEQVLLRWQTLTEQGNDGFYVQQLIGDEWRHIAFVPTAANGGNSTDRLQYQFVAAALKGTAQYRIKMQGLNGVVEYSDVRIVKSGDRSGFFSVYPNPSFNGSSSAFFVSAGQHLVEVYDMAGRVIRSYKGNNQQVDIDGLGKGVYVVKASDNDNNTQTQKLVVR